MEGGRVAASLVPCMEEGWGPRSVRRAGRTFPWDRVYLFQQLSPFSPIQLRCHVTFYNILILPLLSITSATIKVLLVSLLDYGSSLLTAPALARGLMWKKVPQQWRWGTVSAVGGPQRLIGAGSPLLGLCSRQFAEKPMGWNLARIA